MAISNKMYPGLAGTLVFCVAGIIAAGIFIGPIQQVLAGSPADVAKQPEPARASRPVLLAQQVSASPRKLSLLAPQKNSAGVLSQVEIQQQLRDMVKAKPKSGSLQDGKVHPFFKKDDRSKYEAKHLFLWDEDRPKYRMYLGPDK